MNRRRTHNTRNAHITHVARATLELVQGEVRPQRPLSGMLTPGQIARAGGISIRTVQQWLLLGVIAGHRSPTGRWWVPRSELERLKSGAFDARFARDDDWR